MTQGKADSKVIALTKLPVPNLWDQYKEGLIRAIWSPYRYSISHNTKWQGWQKKILLVTR